MSFRKRIFGALVAVLLTFGSLAFAAALGEIIIRTFFPQEEIAEWFRPDKDYGFSLKPNFSQDFRYVGHDFVMHVRTNALGFRDREWTFPKPRGARTLLLLGDSFVFGYGVNVENRLDARLATLLNAEGARWEILDAGVPGWGTRNETAYARAHFDLFQPDVIALVFCGNDPSDDAGENKPSLPAKSWIPGKTFFRAHSDLYRFLLRQVFLLRHRKQLWDKQQQASGAPHFDSQSAALISEQDWAATLALIRDFHRDFLGFNPQGVLLVLATAPDNADIRAHLASLDNGRNLLYVDLSPRIADLPPEARRLPYDAHWSPALHEIAAQAIHDAIESRAHE